MTDERKFQLIALDRYCQHYIKQYDISISKIFESTFEEIQQKYPDQKSEDFIMAIARYVYNHKRMPGLTNEQILEKFVNSIYESETWMQRVLSVPELRTWHMLQRR